MDTAAKHFSFLNENDPMNWLNSSNYLDQLVPIIKTNIQNDTINQVVENLSAELEKKDDELVDFINSNEPKINGSTDEISSISRNANKINEQLMDINTHLFKTSNVTLEKKLQLLALKKNINKIDESCILINKILQILELTDKTQELIKTNKFFNALKNLNDLNALSNEFDQNLTFLNHINDSIPVLKNLIKDESLTLLKRNLNSIDSKYENIAVFYMDKFEYLISKWNTFRKSNKDYERFKINSSVEISLRSVYLPNSEQHQQQQQEIEQVDKFINLNFIFDSYSIFKILNQEFFFKNEFNKEMNLKRDKILYPFILTDSKNDNFKTYIKNKNNLIQFLNKLIGFIIIYNFIPNKIPNLINQSSFDLWENLSAKLYPFFKNLLLNETIDLSNLLELKPVFGNSYLILEYFQLNYNDFYNLLIIIFKKYIQHSIFKFKQEFEKISEDDDSMPMVVFDSKLYKKILNITWYKEEESNDDQSDDEKFPKVLPFSSIYPMACAEIRNFIYEQDSFLSDYYKHDLTSINELIVLNIDRLLSSVINEHYIRKLDITTREELSQNLINLEYFLIMSKELSKELSLRFNKDIKLKAIQLFQNTRKSTESKLFEMVDGKIEDLLDFINYDWETDSFNTEPNYFIKDIGDFLKNMFNSTFSNLPYSVKSLLLYRVFDVLALRFLENLNEAEKLTKASISNFDIDISYFEVITKELNPNANSNDDSLQSMFAQLRQTINLLKIGNLEEYKDQSIRMRKYNQVKPDQAVKLLQKLEPDVMLSPLPNSTYASSSTTNSTGNNNVSGTTSPLSRLQRSPSTMGKFFRSSS